MARLAGGTYYRKMGYKMIPATMEKKDIMALKIMASRNGKTLISTVEEAISWMSLNLESLPATLPSPCKEKTIRFLVSKEQHLSLKAVAIVTEQPMREVLSFLVTVWARTNGNPS